MRGPLHDCSIRAHSRHPEVQTLHRKVCLEGWAAHACGPSFEAREGRAPQDDVGGRGWHCTPDCASFHPGYWLNWGYGTQR